MSERLVHIDGIGEVRIQRMRRKTISVQLKPFRSPVVKIPWYCTFRQGVDFAKSKKAWINKKQQEHAAIEAQTLLFEMDKTYSIRNQSLIIASGSNAMPSKFKRGNTTTISISLQQLSTEDGQQYCKKVYEEILRVEAKAYLPERLAVLAARFGLLYNKVVIRNTRSRWGSCSHRDNISLSLHLMRLPDHLIDYVLLHELAHTKEKHHGRTFWEYLDILTDGQARALDREVKQHQLRYY